MGKKKFKQQQQRPARRPWWRGVLLGALGLVAIGIAAFWWFSEAQNTAGGTARLVLDREVVDLGYLRFEAPARVVFLLTNTGDGPLKLADVPRVKVLKGC
ncbi:MAG TPA: hypothetical protein VJO34_04915 [Methylomirabilota bacterium]|nr:hypothetical protein [Methylomirabilota bacterium]